MQPWRMRHGEAIGDDLVAGDVDHHAAIHAVVAPAILDVGARDRGRVDGPPVGHRHAVEVAAILGRERRDEGRLPDRAEIARVADRGDAGIERADEQRPAIGADADIMRVDAAGRPGEVGNVDRVERARLAGAHDIVEAVELELGGERDAARAFAHRQPHAAREIALEQRDGARRVAAQEQQLAGLIGGEHQAAADPRQP